MTEREIFEEFGKLSNNELFRIDIYITKCCLAVEIDEKGHTDGENLPLNKKDKRH